MYTTEFVDIPLVELLARVQTLKHEGFRFVQMCGETTEAGTDLLYTFYDEVRDNALNLCVYGIGEDTEVPSIQELYFAAFSYENETHDLFGVHFINMKLDFGGHFFNVAEEAPMTVITPEMKAEREKLAKHWLSSPCRAPPGPPRRARPPRRSRPLRRRLPPMPRKRPSPPARAPALWAISPTRQPRRALTPIRRPSAPPRWRPSSPPWTPRRPLRFAPRLPPRLPRPRRKMVSKHGNPFRHPVWPAAPGAAGAHPPRPRR